MPLIQANELQDDLEDKPVKEGSYELRVAKADYKKTKSGEDDMIALMFTVEGSDGDGATPMNHYLTMPKDTDEPRVRKMRMRDLKRMLTVLGVPFDGGFDPETQTQELVGQTGTFKVIQEDYEGTPQNRIRLPRLD